MSFWAMKSTIHNHTFFEQLLKKNMIWYHSLTEHHSVNRKFVFQARKLHKSLINKAILFRSLCWLMWWFESRMLDYSKMLLKLCAQFYNKQFKLCGKRDIVFTFSISRLIFSFSRIKYWWCYKSVFKIDS